MTSSADVLRIDSNDNVAIALGRIEAGESLHFDQKRIVAKEPIPQGHKVALTSIEAGDQVIKYGHAIGSANKPIQPGQWMHTHNMQSALQETQDYIYQPSPKPAFGTNRTFSFDGFLRQDGKAGIRNEIWIIPTVGCINSIAEMLAARANAELKGGNIDGVYHFAHPYGCSQLGGDLKATQQLLAALVHHPNAGGVLVIGLGCENNQINDFKTIIGPYDETRVKFYNLQDVEDEIEQGMAMLKQLVSHAAVARRQPLPVSKLVLGLKCGGSDAFSGITANPLLGEISDGIIAEGGSAVLTEVPEMFGAETILMNRAKDEATFHKIVRLINDFKDYFLRHSQPIYENPSPGNKQGGITTLEEKSLGCIRKGGRSPVMDVFAYGRQISGHGLMLLNGPGNDMVSTTALAAAGAQLVLFTTGRGTPFGGPVPTIKIASNSAMAVKKKIWIDFDAGRLLSGETMETLVEEFFEKILRIASGKLRTKNERFNARQIAIFKDGVTL
ncbi:MAG: altronate dehydratase family protein [Desulfobacteraceae bacterium]|jgi:altronate hydrolase